MNPDVEIRRLLDVMPASGRMLARLEDRPAQRAVIATPFPKPWMRVRPITINFDLWQDLSRPERDLVLLQKVCWTTAIRWFKPDLPRLEVLAGLVGVGVEFAQADAIGVLAAASLVGAGAVQIWRSYRSARLELEADEQAIRVATRRGYSEAEAATYLLSAIEKISRIEGRGSLSFEELLRSQNLRSIAGLSSIGVPDSVRRE